MSDTLPDPGKQGVADTTPQAVGSPSRRRILLFKLIVLSVPLLFVALVEMGFALRFRMEYPGATLVVQGRYRYVDAPYRIYGNNPNYVRRRDGVSYRYNNCGFREEEDLGPKGPNEFRVFFMGGSASYGSPAWERHQFRSITGQTTYPSSETIAAHLEEALQQRMPYREVNVINAAVTNYSIHHVYLTYLGLVRLLSPDLIVTMDGWNEDFGSANPYGRAITVREKSGSSWISALRSHSYTIYYAGFLAARLRGVQQEEDVSQAQFDAMTVEQVRHSLQDVIARNEPEPENLDELMKVYESFWYATQLDGVPILFMTQPLPTLDTTKVLTPREEKLLKYRYITLKPQVEAGLIGMDTRLAERASQDPSYYFLSLLSIFAEYPDLAYTDHCHISPGGNQHLARRVADYIAAVPEWMEREPVHRSPLPLRKDRLWVDASCGGL